MGHGLLDDNIFTNFTPADVGDRPVENCGIVGIYDTRGQSAYDLTYKTLWHLRHRGQESFGITARGTDGAFHWEREMGSVAKGFSTEQIESLYNGHADIGHVRYSTAGTTDIDHAQPFRFHGKIGEFYLAHNGNIRNADTLSKELIEEGLPVETNSDSELLGHIISKHNSVAEGIGEINQRAEGSLSLVVLTSDGVYGYRGQNGIKPLCLGYGNGSIILASESCAFNYEKMSFDRNLLPGELIHVSSEGTKSFFFTPKPFALDIFELIYFARPDSEIDGISVSEFRYNCGRLLAEKDKRAGLLPWKGSSALVTSIPYSGNTYAEGYAIAAGLPYRQIFHRVRDTRSFIQPVHMLRESAAEEKLVPLKRVIQSADNLFVIDDSEVRGVTTKKNVQKIKELGERKIHMRFGSPEVKGRCPFGIDMKTEDEHIANKIPDLGKRAEYYDVVSILHLDEYDILEAARKARLDTAPYGKYNAPEIISFCTHCFTRIDPLSPQFVGLQPSFHL